MKKNQKDSFETFSDLSSGGRTYRYASLEKLQKKISKPLSRLPYSLRVLLENLLRNEDEVAVKKGDIEALCNWDPKATPEKEIQFTPARIILQDFTGVPAVADLAAMRGAIQKLGGDPSRINPLQPADLVIDHSVQVDFFGDSQAKKKNTEIEFERNQERYQFLRWGQNAFKNFRVVPPDTGIVHQVNLEYLAHVAMTSEMNQKQWVYPDTLVGTDSHTTMINGLGVVGWGVGGIEAEAAMLGQPVTMLIPQVVGFRLKGKLPAGTTATDLVLVVVEMLRKKGVVGKFVEFTGPGLANLTLADRATIANMAPEYGATIGVFPVDEQTTNYLRLTGRNEDDVKKVEDYFKAQNLWFTQETPEPEYTDLLELDMSTVEPSLAGPSRPQDRVLLSEADSKFKKSLPSLLKEGSSTSTTSPVKDPSGNQYDLSHGSVVIAAITSCTNTSNPSVLMAAGLLAKKAVEKRLQTKPWVKSSLAPGSKTVTDYLVKANLMNALETLRFNVVGYGCTTCIGNSGPLPSHIEKAITEGGLVVSSVLSGNRNFEGRISPLVRANYLASPPLVVAYALAGNMNINLKEDPIGTGKDGKPVFLKDIWPTQEEVQKLISTTISSSMFQSSYSDVFKGPKEWQALKVPTGELYEWNPDSTYIKEPPFFDDMTADRPPVQDIKGAHILALLKDSVTTDHISPAGSIPKNEPAGKYLISNGVDPKEFNSFGSRRGNHEVMMRGTFGNVRLRNELVPGVEGGYTQYLPEKAQMSIFDASMKYQKAGTPLVILAGKEYGTGSSRDWAAKGTRLLGVRAVIAESFERIHRSNLIGMGVLPTQFMDGKNPKSLGLDGTETFDIQGLEALQPGQVLDVTAHKSNGESVQFKVLARTDTPNEVEYFKHGGILLYVLRQALKS